MSTYAKQRGFTLIELIVAITISAVVVGFMAMFIVTPIQAYFAQARRAELVDAATIALRSLSNDVRNALPNSPRVAVSGSVASLELLAVVDMATYRAKDTAGNTAQELDTSVADTSFSTLGKFNKPRPIFPRTDHYLVINHTGSAGADAYQLTNVITPSGTTINITTNAATNEDQVTLNSAFHFIVPPTYLTNHVFLVSGPVKYVCDTAAHTLTSYSGYAIAGINNTAAPTGVGVVQSLIANDVTACQFIAVASTAQHGDLVSVTLKLSRDGENLTLFRQISVENIP